MSVAAAVWRVKAKGRTGSIAVRADIFFEYPGRATDAAHDGSIRQAGFRTASAFRLSLKFVCDRPCGGTQFGLASLFEQPPVQAVTSTFDRIDEVECGALTVVKSEATKALNGAQLA